MDTQLNCQSFTVSFTRRTILPAVKPGPDGILRGSFSPLARTFTCVPPMSITRILGDFGGCAALLLLREFFTSGNIDPTDVSSAIFASSGIGYKNHSRRWYHSPPYCESKLEKAVRRIFCDFVCRVRGFPAASVCRRGLGDRGK